MELGTGIFLSAVVLGVVAIFIATKDRWNWGKVARRAIFSIVALVLVVLGGIYAYDWYQDRPTLQKEFRGVALGEKYQDVVFRHGALTRDVSADVELLARWMVENERLKGSPSFEEKATAYKRAKLLEEQEVAGNVIDTQFIVNDSTVTFKNGVVNDIFYGCQVAGGDYTSVNRIGCGDSSEDIDKKYGRDIRVLCEKSPVNASRVYDGIAFGTRYYLTKNRVVGFMVTTPTNLEKLVGLSWAPCK